MANTKVQTAKLSAASLHAKFLKENNIKLDYTLVENRMIPVDDGFLLKQKHPTIKVTVSYG